MSIFIDQSFIGGVSVARNPILEEKIENGVKTHHLMLLDCNNQYGDAMMQHLPTGGFKWDPEAVNMTAEDILNLNDQDSTARIFEVDLDYPEELHDEHDQYPLAPEHYQIKEGELSSFQRGMAVRYGIKMNNTTKLCLTLHGKVKYKLHQKNLRQYLKHGMKLKKIHRVLRFKQEPWIRDYIECNTMLRQSAKTKHDQALPKLMNNSVFGKTCEDPSKYQEVKLVCGEHSVKRMQRWQNQQTFKT